MPRAKQNVFLLLLNVVLLLMFSCKNEIQEAMEAETGVLLPTQVIYDGNISYSSGGVITSRLRSPEIRRFQNKDSTVVYMQKGFTAVFYDSAGHFESELTAEKGTWYETRRVMYGEKNVVFRNRKGETLKTQRLTWLQDSARIITDDSITIIRPDGLIRGVGLTAAEDFSNYTIRQITGTLYVNEVPVNEEDTLP